MGMFQEQKETNLDSQDELFRGGGTDTESKQERRRQLHQGLKMTIEGEETTYARPRSRQ